MISYGSKCCDFLPLTYITKAIVYCLIFDCLSLFKCAFSIRNFPSGIHTFRTSFRLILQTPTVTLPVG